MTKIITISALLFFIIGCKDSSVEKKKDDIVVKEAVKSSSKTISFTFDDGVTSDLGGFAFEDWNQMLLKHLDTNNLKAIFYVTGKNKLDKKGQYLLTSWNEKGHNIANHTFTHPNFNSEKNNTVLFENELNKTDSIISKFSNSVKYFRFPYLKEGASKLKVDSIRNVLKAHKYKNGYVTIDASDWYINQRLLKRIKEVGLDKADIDQFKKYYLQHLIDRANYYEKLSYELNDRHINHTILLHHNLTSALFLGDLIQEFKNKGWTVIDADKAYADEVFENQPNSEFAGESLIWSLAKQSGKYENILRYPAEDSRYEKDEMDARGL
ncbi:polysaccharide deacetylase family protein [Maribacter sp. BPC-D8]|uniref:polysaccharide deacetylase family protein n=1 Tax=Maribacter sp. BPC-D8 TaxID=3053613 RepID=UPI002B497E1B|nr:polysaccharide deacetylase family protein [Maribacter sp. BPC-D8]WRI28860.1 polysaccharide deacetylase family protein [Maribacter sp. BPC-D8]